MNKKKKIISVLYATIASTSLVSCSQVEDNDDGYLKYKVINNNIVEVYFNDPLKIPAPNENASKLDYTITSLPAGCEVNTVDEFGLPSTNSSETGETYISTSLGNDISSNYIGDINCPDSGNHSFTYTITDGNKIYTITPNWNNSSDTHINSEKDGYTEDVSVEGDSIVPVPNPNLLKLLRSSSNKEYTEVKYTYKEQDIGEHCQINTVGEDGHIIYNAPEEGISYIREGDYLSFEISCANKPGDHVYEYSVSVNDKEMSSGAEILTVQDYDLSSSVDGFKATFKLDGAEVNTTTAYLYQLEGVDSQCTIEKTKLDGTKEVTTDLVGTTYVANDGSAITIDCEGQSSTHNITLQTDVASVIQKETATILVSDYNLDDTVNNNTSIFKIDGNDINNTSTSKATSINYSISSSDLSSCKIYKVDSEGEWELTQSLNDITYANVNNEIIKVDCNGLVGNHSINLTTIANKISHGHTSNIDIADYDLTNNVSNFKATFNLDGSEVVVGKTEISYTLEGVDSQCTVEKTKADGTRETTTALSGTTYVANDGSAITVDCEGQIATHNVILNTTINSITKNSTAEIKVSSYELDDKVENNISTFDISGADIKNISTDNATPITFNLSISDSLCNIYKLDLFGSWQLMDSGLLSGTTYANENGEFLKIDCNGIAGNHEINLSTTANKIDKTTSSNINIANYDLTSEKHLFKAIFSLNGSDINSSTEVSYHLYGVDGQCTVEKTKLDGTKEVTTDLIGTTYVANDGSAITVDCEGQTAVHNITLETTINSVVRESSRTLLINDYDVDNTVANNTAVFTVKGDDIVDTTSEVVGTSIAYTLDNVSSECVVSELDSTGNWTTTLTGITHANIDGQAIKVDCNGVVGNHSITLTTTANKIQNSDTANIQLKDYNLTSKLINNLTAVFSLNGNAIDTNNTIVLYTLTGIDEDCTIQKTKADGTHEVTTELSGTTYVASDGSTITVDCAGKVATHNIGLESTVNSIIKNKSQTIEVSDNTLNHEISDNSAIFTLTGNDLNKIGSDLITPITYDLTGSNYSNCVVSKFTATGAWEVTTDLIGTTYANTNNEVLKVNCNNVPGENTINLTVTANKITDTDTATVELDSYNVDSSVKDFIATFNASGDAITAGTTEVSYTLTGVDANCTIQKTKADGTRETTTALSGTTYIASDGSAITVDCEGEIATHSIKLDTVVNSVEKDDTAEIVVSDYTLANSVNDNTAVFTVTGNDIKDTSQGASATVVDYDLTGSNYSTCVVSKINSTGDWEVTTELSGTTYANTNNEIIKVDCNNVLGTHTINLATTANKINHSDSTNAELKNYAVSSSVTDFVATFNASGDAITAGTTEVSYTLTGVDANCTIQKTKADGTRETTTALSGTTYVAGDGSAITVDCEGEIATHSIKLDTIVNSVKKDNTAEIVVSDYTLANSVNNNTAVFTVIGNDIKDTSQGASETAITYDLTGSNYSTCVISKINSTGAWEVTTELSGTTYANTNNEIIKVDCNNVAGTHTINLATTANKIDHNDSSSIELKDYTVSSSVTDFVATFNASGDAITAGTTEVSYTLTGVDANCTIQKTKADGTRETTTALSGTTYVAGDGSAIIVDCEGEIATHSIKLDTVVNSVEKDDTAEIVVSDYTLANSINNNTAVFTVTGNDIKDTSQGASATVVDYDLTGSNYSTCVVSKINSTGAWEVITELSGTTYANSNNEVIKVDCNTVIGTHTINLATTANKIDHNDSSSIELKDYTVSSSVTDFIATFNASGDAITAGTTEVSYTLTGVDANCTIQKTKADGTRETTTALSGTTYVAGDGSAIAVDCEGEIATHSIKLDTVVNSVEKDDTAEIVVSDYTLANSVNNNTAVFTVIGNDIKDTSQGASETAITYDLTGSNYSTCVVSKINSTGAWEVTTELSGTTYANTNNEIIKVNCNNVAGSHTINLATTANKIDHNDNTSIELKDYVLNPVKDNFVATFNLTGNAITAGTTEVSYTLIGAENCVIQKTKADGTRETTTALSGTTYVAGDGSAITVDCEGSIGTHNIILETNINSVQKTNSTTPVNIVVSDYNLTISDAKTDYIPVVSIVGPDINNTDSASKTSITYNLSGIESGCTIYKVAEDGTWETTTESSGTTYANTNNEVIKVDCQGQAHNHNIYFTTTANSISHTLSTDFEVNDYVLSSETDKFITTFNLAGDEIVNGTTTVEYNLTGSENCTIQKTKADGTRETTTELSGTTYVASDGSAITVDCEGSVGTHYLILQTNVDTVVESESASITVANYSLSNDTNNNVGTFNIDGNDISNTDTSTPTEIAYNLSGSDYSSCIISRIDSAGNWEVTTETSGTTYANTNNEIIKVDCNSIVGQHNIVINTTANKIDNSNTLNLNVKDFAVSSSVTDFIATFNASGDAITAGTTEVSYTLTGVDANCTIQKTKADGTRETTTALSGTTYVAGDGSAITVDCEGSIATHSIKLDAVVNSVEKDDTAEIVVSDYALANSVNDNTAVFTVIGNDIKDTSQGASETAITYDLTGSNYSTCVVSKINSTGAWEVTTELSGTTYANSNNEVIKVDCNNVIGTHTINLATTANKIDHNDSSSIELKDYTVSSSVTDFVATFNASGDAITAGATEVSYTLTGVDANCTIQKTKADGTRETITALSGTTYVAGDGSAITVDCEGEIATHSIKLDTVVNSVEKDDTAEIVVSDYTLANSVNNNTAVFTVIGNDIKDTSQGASETAITYDLTGSNYSTCVVSKINSTGAWEVTTELSGTTYANSNNEVIKVDCNNVTGTHTINLATTANKIDHNDSSSIELKDYTVSSSVTDFVATFNASGDAITAGTTEVSYTLTGVDANCTIQKTKADGTRETTTALSGTTYVAGDGSAITVDCEGEIATHSIKLDTVVNSVEKDDTAEIVVSDYTLANSVNNNTAVFTVIGNDIKDTSQGASETAITYDLTGSNYSTCVVSKINSTGAWEVTTELSGTTYANSNNEVIKVDCNNVIGTHTINLATTANKIDHNDSSSIELKDYTVSSSVTDFVATFNASGDAITAGATEVSYTLTGVDANCTIQKTKADGTRETITALSGTTYVAGDGSAITVDCEGEIATHSIKLDTVVNSVEKDDTAEIVVSDYTLANSVNNNTAVFTVIGNDIKDTSQGASETAITYDLTGSNYSTCVVSKINSTGAWEVTTELSGTTYANSNNEVIKVDCNNVIGTHTINLATTANKIDHNDSSSIELKDYTVSSFVTDFVATFNASGDAITAGTTEVSYTLTGVDANCTIQKTKADGTRETTTALSGTTYVAGDGSAITVDCEGSIATHSIKLDAVVNSVEKDDTAEIVVSDYTLANSVNNNTAVFTVIGNDIKDTSQGASETAITYDLTGSNYSTCVVSKINSTGAWEVTTELSGTTYANSNNEVIKVDCNNVTGTHTINLATTANKITHTGNSVAMTLANYVISATTNEFTSTLNITSAESSFDYALPVTYNITGADGYCTIKRVNESGDKEITTETSGTTYIQRTDSDFLLSVDCEGDIHTHNIDFETTINSVNKTDSATILVSDYSLDSSITNGEAIFTVIGNDINDTNHSNPTDIYYDFSGSSDLSSCKIYVSDISGNFQETSDLSGFAYAQPTTGDIIKVNCSNTVGDYNLNLQTEANKIQHNNSNTIAIKDYQTSSSVENLKAIFNLTGDAIETTSSATPIIVDYTLTGVNANCIIEKTDISGNKVVTSDTTGTTYVAVDGSTITVNCEGEIGTHDISLDTVVNTLEKNQQQQLVISDYTLSHTSESPDVIFNVSGNDINNTDASTDKTPITYTISGSYNSSCVIYKVDENGDYIETTDVTGTTYANTTNDIIKVSCLGLVGTHNITVDTTARNIDHTDSGSVTIENYDLDHTVSDSEGIATYTIEGSAIETTTTGTPGTLVNYTLTGVNENCTIQKTDENGEKVDTTEVSGTTYVSDDNSAIIVDCEGVLVNNNNTTFSVKLETSPVDGNSKDVTNDETATLKTYTYTIASGSVATYNLVYRVYSSQIDTDTPIEYSVDLKGSGCAILKPNGSSSWEYTTETTGTTRIDSTSDDYFLRLDCTVGYKGSYSPEVTASIYKVEKSTSRNVYIPSDYTLTMRANQDSTYHAKYDVTLIPSNYTSTSYGYEWSSKYTVEMIDNNNGSDIKDWENCTYSYLQSSGNEYTKKFYSNTSSPSTTSQWYNGTSYPNYLDCSNAKNVGKHSVTLKAEIYDKSVEVTVEPQNSSYFSLSYRWMLWTISTTNYEVIYVSEPGVNNSFYKGSKMGNVQVNIDEFKNKNGQGYKTIGTGSSAYVYPSSNAHLNSSGWQSLQNTYVMSGNSENQYPGGIMLLYCGSSSCNGSSTIYVRDQYGAEAALSVYFNR